MGLVVEVQRPCLVHLLQLLPVPKVQCEVSGDDGFADDLQHLLVLAGAQGGEDIVPFQLQRNQRKTTSSTQNAKCHCNDELREAQGLFGYNDGATAYMGHFTQWLPLATTKPM